MPDDVTELMRESGVPITRENYIDAAWGGEPPPWNAELEAQLPEELQDWSLYKVERGELVLRKPSKPPPYEPPQEGEVPSIYDELKLPKE